MLRVIEAKKTIKSLNDRLRRRILQARSWKGDHPMGFRGETAQLETAWLADPGFFFAWQDAGNRAWNAYGLDDPRSTHTIAPVLEINFPWSGIDRRIGGVFLEDPSTGDVVIGHRGRIGGGRSGIGQRAFFDHYRGELVAVQDGNRSSVVAQVAAIDSDDLLPELRAFIGEVDRVKRLAVGAAEPAADTFSPEFEGIVRYERAASETVYRARHGAVVGALAEALAEAGHVVANDRARDIFTLGPRRRVRHLFEVKTIVSTTAIYGAIGQLLVHGHGANAATKLYLVVPLRPAASFAKALRRLGIRTITYDWNAGVPRISRLPSP